MSKIVYRLYWFILSLKDSGMEEFIGGKGACNKWIKEQITKIRRNNEENIC